MSSTPPTSIPAPKTVKSANRSPALVPQPMAPITGNAPSSLSPASSRPKPVDPAVLADAMKNLDTLRQTKTPTASAAPSAAVSPAASGSSSPQPSGQLQLENVETVLQKGAQTQPAPTPPSGIDSKGISAPGTPHFGAQTEL